MKIETDQLKSKAKDFEQVFKLIKFLINLTLNR